MRGFAVSGALEYLAGNVQAMHAQRVVEALQHARSGGQVGSGREFTPRVVFGENPAVVLIARLAVGHGGGIAQQHVLAQPAADDAADTAVPGPGKSSPRSVRRFPTCCSRSFLPSAWCISVTRFTWSMDGGVNIRFEGLVSQRKYVGFARLRFYAQVKVARVMPSADVHARHHVALRCTSTVPVSGHSRRLWLWGRVPCAHRPCGRRRAIRGISRSPRMWHICTGRKYSSTGCQTPRSYTFSSMRKMGEEESPYFIWYSPGSFTSLKSTFR